MIHIYSQNKGIVEPEEESLKRSEFQKINNSNLSRKDHGEQSK